MSTIPTGKVLEAPTLPVTKIEENTSSAAIQKSERDVVLDHTLHTNENNSRDANQLLGDFVRLPRKSTSNDLLARRLHNLFQNGIGYYIPHSPCISLHGKGRFVRVVNGQYTIAPEKDAIEFIQQLIEEVQMNKNGSKDGESKTVIKTENMDIDTLKKIEEEAKTSTSKVQEVKTEAITAKEAKTEGLSTEKVHTQKSEDATKSKEKEVVEKEGSNNKVISDKEETKNEESGQEGKEDTSAKPATEESVEKKIDKSQNSSVTGIEDTMTESEKSKETSEGDMKEEPKAEETGGKSNEVVEKETSNVAVTGSQGNTKKNEELKKGTPAVVAKEEAVAKKDIVSAEEAIAKEIAARSQENIDDKPGAYDIKLMRNGEKSDDVGKHKGNTRFLQILHRNVSVLLDHQAKTHSSRVETTTTVLRETTNVFEEITGRFFVKESSTTSQEVWKLLEDDEAAEVVLLCVFDTFHQRDMRTREKKMQLNPPSITREDLKSLIPTIGTAEISQFMDYSKPSLTPVEKPSDSDVLFGRGGMTNNHPGNKRFRDVISLHRPDYVRAIKIEKPNVARKIVAAIRGGSPPGRFLKRDPKNLMWYDVGNRHATEKTSQALREKSQAEKNNGSISSEGDSRKRLLEQALYEARSTRMRLSKGIDPVRNDNASAKGFQLTVTPQVWAYNLRPDNLAALHGNIGDQLKLENKPEACGNGMVLPASSLRLDLRDFSNMPDTTVINGPSTSIGVLDNNGDILVTDNDILCGRGGMTNHHKGNKRFRDIVALHRPDYVRANKVNKPAVARMIIKAIRSGDPPGRFLKKDETTGKWFDIGDRRAAEKASQALREKTPEERSRLRAEQLSAASKAASLAASKAASSKGAISKTKAKAQRPVQSAALAAAAQKAIRDAMSVELQMEVNNSSVGNLPEKRNPDTQNEELRDRDECLDVETVTV